MIKYEDLVKKMIDIANRHPNINFVEYNIDTESFNNPHFNTPCFIISPYQTTRTENSFIRYGFQLIYADKLTQEEDCFLHIMEDSIIFIHSFLSILDLEHKVISNNVIDPIIDGYEGGSLCGSQTLIEIEDILNIEKYKSVFYGSNTT